MGIDHQRGFMASFFAATGKLFTKNDIVNAQVLAGGRGKGTFNTGYLSTQKGFYLVFFAARCLDRLSHCLSSPKLRRELKISCTPFSGYLRTPLLKPTPATSG